MLKLLHKTTSTSKQFKILCCKQSNKQSDIFKSKPYVLSDKNYREMVDLNKIIQQQFKDNLDNLTNEERIKFLQTKLNTLLQQLSSETKSPMYSSGFQNTESKEILTAALPESCSNPKILPQNLTAEQITGPGGFNNQLKLWIYKMNRTVESGLYTKSVVQPFENVKYLPPNPNVYKIKPPLNKNSFDKTFVHGIETVAIGNDIKFYRYNFSQSMTDNNEVFHNADGEMMIQPSKGELQIITECGIMDIEPNYICVIPKNLKFQVNPKSGPSSGVIFELLNNLSFVIPHKGVVGANGLANREDFQTVSPQVDNDKLFTKHKLYNKYCDIYYDAVIDHSPFDVIAWKGNYAPYRYNLKDFVPIGATDRDHLDPSCHCVMTAGNNQVFFIAFHNRQLISNPKQPTYRLPYDHRNVGFSEMMHYLGKQDAREGNIPGNMTFHVQGSHHGNDRNSYEKEKTAPLEDKQLQFSGEIATMIEAPGIFRIAENMVEYFDESHAKSMLGVKSTFNPNYKQNKENKQSLNKKIETKDSKIGIIREVRISSGTDTFIAAFDKLMPNYKTEFNENNGLVQKRYTNSHGQHFSIKQQHNQDEFWRIYKGLFELSTEDYKINLQKINDNELQDCVKCISQQMSKGSHISSLQYEVPDPELTYNYFMNAGLHTGRTKNSIRLSDTSSLQFKFIESVPHNHNEKSFLALLDHTVINGQNYHLKNIYKIFPYEFWGGDTRDLRSEGVQFNTRVLTSDQENHIQLIPFNNLDKTEEEILERIQNNDTFLPPQIKKAAYNNQITRSLIDFNRTYPHPDKDVLLQHAAFQINEEFIPDFDFEKQCGVRTFPPPSEMYYNLTKVDLSQRITIPYLFSLLGVDPFSIHSSFYNTLLKPKDSSINRMNEILIELNVSKDTIKNILNVYQKLQPIFEYIGNNIDIIKDDKFINGLTEIFKVQNINITQNTIKDINGLLLYNNHQIDKNKKAGTLLDFQILSSNTETGYLQQTFSVPIGIESEGRACFFFEFLKRTCLLEVYEGASKYGQTLNEQTNKMSINKSSCGAFGQGNFANLMLSQQIGIKNEDNRKTSKKNAFTLTLLDRNEIKNNPFGIMREKVFEIKNSGDLKKAERMKYHLDIMEMQFEEAKKRNINVKL